MRVSFFVPSYVPIDKGESCNHQRLINNKESTKGGDRQCSVKSAAVSGKPTHEPV